MAAPNTEFPMRYGDFVVRPWQARDRAVAAAVIRQVLLEYGLPWEPELADRDVIAVETHYCQRGGEFWVVERAGASPTETAIVGTGAYYPVAVASVTGTQPIKAAEIRKMYLLPAARGRGLGRFLLAQLERAIAARGFTEIRVETASALVEAVRLYERNDYEPISEVETARCDRAYRKAIGR